MAAAEDMASGVSLAGNGTIGLSYNEANSDAVGDTNSLARINLDVTTVTQSDVGIEFGGTFRYRSSQSDAKVTSGDLSGAKFHAAMGPVKLEVGNINDAINNMPGRSAGTLATLTNGGNVLINSRQFFASQGPGAVNGVNLQYGMAGLAVQLSALEKTTPYTITDTAAIATGNVAAGDVKEKKQQVAGHVAYTMSGWTLAGGVLDDEDGKDIAALSVTGDLGFATVGGAFSRNDDAFTNAAGTKVAADRVRLNAKIPMGATTLIVWATDEDRNDFKNAAKEVDGHRDGGSFGLELAHDLGGGVTFVAAYDNIADHNVNKGKGDELASAELQFKF